MESFLFGVDTKKLSQLGPLDENGTPTVAADRAIKFSSEEHLFLRLRSSSQLRSVFFDKGEIVLNRGDLVKAAHVIFQGTACVQADDTVFYMGPGAVIGLAEGLSGEPMRWTIQAETMLYTRTIPIEKAVQEIRTTDAGLRGICRVVAMRTLGIDRVPENLR